MRRHGRRVTFAVTLLSIALVASGCFFLDTNRRNNFSGPSWDVPFAIALYDGTIRVSGEEEDTEFSESEEFVISLEGWNGDKASLDVLADDLADVTLDFEFDLPDLGDMSDVFDEDLEDKITLFSDAYMDLRISGDEGLHGELTLNITGISAVPGEGAIKATMKLGTGDTERVQLGSILSRKPTKLQMKFGGDLEAPGAVPEELTIHADIVVPLSIKIDEDVEYELADPESIGMSSEARQALADVPVSDIEFFVDLDEAFPLEFAVQLVFTSDALDNDEVVLTLSVPNSKVDKVDIAAVRDKLLGDDPHVQPRLVLAESDGAIRYPAGAEFSLKAHIILTVDVNTRGDQ